MTASRRQRSSTPNVPEDYYDILSVPIGAKLDVIKDSYLRLIRLFPPESRSEEFEQIRRAYETLRDPRKRKQYDFARKYGSDVDDLMDRAQQFLRENKLRLAEQILRRVRELAPGHPGPYISSAAIALRKGNERRFQVEMQGVLALFPGDEERARLHAVFADMLAHAGRGGEALALLDVALERYPRFRESLQRTRVDLLRQLHRFDEALEVVEAHLRDVQADTPSEAGWFLLRVGLMVEMERWQDWSQVRSRIRRFFRCLTTEDDTAAVVSDLIGECDAYADVEYFKGALAFLDLALYLTPKDKNLVERRRKLEERLQSDRELRKLLSDQRVALIVVCQVVRWAVEVGDADSMQELLRDMEADLHDAIDNESLFHEEITAGILHVRRHYPAVYRRFETSWKKLYGSHVDRSEREGRPGVR